MHIPELLAPAGNFERLRVALHYGADAVYLGMRRMSLRNFADNFTLDELHAACTLAHGMGRRVYVTVNAFAHDSELSELPAFLRDVEAAGADAMIVNDPGVLMLARNAVPSMKLHLSTQANTLNAHAASFWHQNGIARIVLARELSLEEVSHIREHTPEALELEIFVHGAMCVSYSGRCLLSNYINSRDSNKGECAQPCRWTYEIRETGKAGEYFPIEQDALGSYILNARDMNLLPHLHAVCKSGVQSLKIEGRMKSIYYVAGVVNAYRMALDAFKSGEESAPGEALCAELHKISHRPYTTGFAFQNPGKEGQYTENAQYLQTHELAAVVLSVQDSAVLIEQRNRFLTGDRLEILSPGDISRSFIVEALHTEDGACVKSAPHPKQRLYLSCKERLRAGDILRRKLS